MEDDQGQKEQLFTILDNLHGAIVITDKDSGDVAYHNI